MEQKAPRAPGGPPGERFDLSLYEESQRRAWELLAELVADLRPGTSEREVVEEAERLLPRYGFEGWLLPPRVLFGRRTALEPSLHPPSRRVRLAPGDPVILDLAPRRTLAAAAVTTSFRFQAEDAPLHAVAREATLALCRVASRHKTAGELFVYARAWAANHRLQLAQHRSIGAVLLPFDPAARRWDLPDRLLPLLPGRRLRFLNPQRLFGIYAVAPHFTDGHTGAAFGEVVVVRGDQRRLLGRASFEEVGTLPPPRGSGS